MPTASAQPASRDSREELFACEYARRMAAEVMRTGPAAMQIDMLHIGARRHYALPLMAERVGFLRFMHTDWYAGPGSWGRSAERVLRGLRGRRDVARMLDRHSELPADKVVAHNLLGLRGKARLRHARNTFERTQAHHWFCKAMSEAMIRETPNPPDAVVSFRGADVLFDHFKGRSVCVLDQIDGGITEVELMKAEQAAHLDWVPGVPDWLEAERDGKRFWLELEAPRLHREWALADTIVCNSRWTQRCLELQGVPADKCRVVPLAYDARTPKEIAPRGSAAGELRIAFLGSLTLRKGVHHLLEAVKLARAECDVRIALAGSSEIELARLRDYKSFADYRGPIPRGAAPAFLAAADMLALPSISEGFGIVQLEAMAHGLPVVTSDRAGDVVRDGIDGFVVPAGDVEALAARLIELARDPQRRADMSRNARLRVEDFSFDRIAEQWRMTMLEARELGTTVRG